MALTILAQPPFLAIRLIPRQHARIPDFGGFPMRHSLFLPLLVEQIEDEEAEGDAAHHGGEDAEGGAEAGDVPRGVAGVVEEWAWGELGRYGDGAEDAGWEKSLVDAVAGASGGN